MPTVQNFSASAVSAALANVGLQQLPTTVEGLLTGIFLMAAADAGGEQQYAGTPSQDAVTTVDGDVLTIGAGQRGFIQNLGTTALAVKYGTGASASSFSFILKAGTAQDDGQGGSVFIEDFAGVVSIAAVSGNVRCIAWTQSLNA